MFGQTSRYRRQPTAIYVDRDGRQHPYVLLRTLPAAAPTRQQYQLTDGDRLDLLAYRFFGDPEQFWRICDANTEPRPEDLELAGETIVIPLVIG